MTRQFHFISGLLVLLCASLTFVFGDVHFSNQKLQDGRVQQKYLPCSKPKTSIVFLKTHKTGTTTVQNLLFRFGDNHNLTFMIPDKPGANYFGHPPPFHRSMVYLGNQEHGWKYDILLHHTRLNASAIRPMVPKGTPFVTIMRRPVMLFESLYTYFNLDKSFGMNLTSFATSAAASLSTKKSPRRFGKNIDANFRFFSRYGRNQISFDLGLDSEDFENRTTVQNFIKHIDKVFDLVMIVERLDESLILLKDLMCWTFDDVLAFHHNKRNPDFVKSMDVETKRNLRNINRADYMLYKHFEKLFDTRVKNFGTERMKREVAVLREQRAAMYNKCVVKLIPSEFTSKSTDLSARKGTEEVCKQLTLNEFGYCKRIEKKMRSRALSPNLV